MNQRQRPPDGPGANGLRGGKNVYSPKVCIGGFVEDIGGPSNYKKGFTNEDFFTENSRYGSNMSGLEYGAGLPMHVSAQQPSTFDVFAPSKDANSSTWQTTTRSTFTTNDFSNKSAPLHVLVANPKADEYRKTWTQDSDAARKFRFQVESRMKSSDKQVAKFEPEDVRLLPGTPMAIEKFRRKLIERHGILSFSALRFHLPRDTVSLGQFRKLIQSLNVDISKSETDQVSIPYVYIYSILGLIYMQVFSYFTPYDEFESSKFMRILLTQMKDYDQLHAHQICAAFAGESKIDMNAFIFRFVSSAYHPEVADGLADYIVSYSEDGFLDNAAVHSLCYDLYASAPFDYIHSLSSLWTL
jgi:hypothetical protein